MITQSKGMLAFMGQCGSLGLKVPTSTENEGIPVVGPDRFDIAMEELRTALNQQGETLKTALEIIAWYQTIQTESHGVTGYHQNGDIAEWDEFEELNQLSGKLDSLLELKSKSQVP